MHVEVVFHCNINSYDINLAFLMLCWVATEEHLWMVNRMQRKAVWLTIYYNTRACQPFSDLSVPGRWYSFLKMDLQYNLPLLPKGTWLDKKNLYWEFSSKVAPWSSSQCESMLFVWFVFWMIHRQPVLLHYVQRIDGYVKGSHSQHWFCL